CTPIDARRRFHRNTGIELEFEPDPFGVPSHGWGATRSIPVSSRAGKHTEQDPDYWFTRTAARDLRQRRERLGIMDADNFRISTRDRARREHWRAPLPPGSRTGR